MASLSDFHNMESGESNGGGSAGMEPDGSRTGHFILSLDTELAWGHHDIFQPEMFSPDGLRERHAIEMILDALDEFDITATWAVVGHLFYDRDEECRVCPAPSLNGDNSWFEQVYDNGHPLWYGKDIIDMLLTRGSRHEIGFHGYTHKVFDEESTSEEEIRVEIEEWLRKADERGLKPGSVVFPRNVIGYKGLLDSYGFTCYRGVEPVSGLHSLPVIGKVLKHLDHILALTTLELGGATRDPAGMIELPASGYLFDYNRRLELTLDSMGLQNLRLRRFKKGIKTAAIDRDTFHLWVHPYEFTSRRDIDKLRFLLEQVAEELARGRMKSVGMSEMSEMALVNSA